MAKNPFTGLDDGTDAPTKSILSGDGALAPIFGDPASRAALLQIGLQMMQPTAMGQTTGGHIAQSISGGGDVEARLSKEEFEKQKHEDELDKSNRTLEIRQQEADAYTTAQKAAAARGATYDRMALQELKDRNAASRLGTKNYAEHAKNTAAQVNDFAFDPKDPANAPLLKYKGKTPSQIETMLRQEDAATGVVEPPKGSQDDAARAWAIAHPNDPRAAAIRQRLGM